jgi:hypothetical protein
MVELSQSHKFAEGSSMDDGLNTAEGFILGVAHRRESVVGWMI